MATLTIEDGIATHEYPADARVIAPVGVRPDALTDDGHLEVKITPEGIIFDLWRTDGTETEATLGMLYQEWAEFLQRRAAGTPPSGLSASRSALYQDVVTAVEALRAAIEGRAQHGDQAVPLNSPQFTKVWATLDALY